MSSKRRQARRDRFRVLYVDPESGCLKRSLTSKWVDALGTKWSIQHTSTAVIATAHGFHDYYRRDVWKHETRALLCALAREVLDSTEPSLRDFYVKEGL